MNMRQRKRRNDASTARWKWGRVTALGQWDALAQQHSRRRPEYFGVLCVSLIRLPRRR